MTEAVKAENSLVLLTQASQMLAEADTISVVESQDRSDQEIAGVYAIFHKTQCIYIGESSCQVQLVENSPQAEGIRGVCYR